MNNVKLLLFFLGALATAEATIYVCIPTQSSDATSASADDVFKSIVNDASKKIKADADEPNAVIEHVDLNITHPAIRLVGPIDDVKIYNLLDFRICFLENIIPDPGHYQFDVFNLTFHNVRVEGVYNVTGDLADIFDVYGDGNFWVELHNLSLAMVNCTINITSDGICLPVNLEIDLQEIRNHFSGLMGDDELEDLFNRVVTDIVPEALKIVWRELEDMFDAALQDEIQDIINAIFGGGFPASLVTTFNDAQNGKPKSKSYCYPE
ncbi:uncharacterized protein LOC135139775 [Zophobas morio]|uniref:uncharacterized protein LOC135139775 n=1 Tax=Zophobas morio TaxID=2755281 RepID=UPI003083AE79